MANLTAREPRTGFLPPGTAINRLDIGHEPTMTRTASQNSR